MKVVFLEDVEGTALVGEIKEVKNGFARNYLLPRQLAAPAVEPHLQRAKSRAIREAKRQEQIDKDAGAVAERIEGMRIVIPARVGEQGKLYGSVTSVHIADEVSKLVGADEFDHRKVLLPEAIKEVGVQPVRLRLTRNVEATIEVEVQAEGVEEEPVPMDDEDASSGGDATVSEDVAEGAPAADASGADDTAPDDAASVDSEEAEETA